MFCKPQGRNNFVWADTLTGVFGGLVWVFFLLLTTSSVSALKVSFCGKWDDFQAVSARDVPELLWSCEDSKSPAFHVYKLFIII